MSQIQRIKATVEQSVNLGTFLATQMSANDIPAYLKSKHYTLKGVQFKAGSVAFTAAGYQKAYDDIRKELSGIKTLKAFNEWKKAHDCN
ncbi:MAG: hypothetical protein PVF17_00180 [Ignavibacteria bacterium]|jgi:hypothetical protein